MKINIFVSVIMAAISAVPVLGQRVELLPYGDFNQWITRDIKESFVIGGDHKTLYAIGPTAALDGNKPYVPAGGSPWATSNVYAKVSGVTKGSNSVEPVSRSAGNQAARLCSKMERVKALGIINLDVMVAGSMYLGRMFEPVTSTSDPYAKMEVGMPYTKRPDAFVIDYKVEMPAGDTRIKSSGFGRKKVLQGRDTPVIFVMLQRRWEDADGNLHAHRVATGGQIFTHASDWVNGHRIPLHYGDVSADHSLSWIGLRSADNTYYARNSKGKLVPVREEGWAAADETPTHVVVMISAGNGEPYVATPDLNFYVDNAGFLFN